MNGTAAALRDEIELLQRSLRDARAEHARGELNDAGLAAIERRDQTRLAAASERLTALGAAATREAPGAPPPGPGVPRPRRSRRLLATCTLALVLAAGTIGVVVGRPFATGAQTIRLDTAGKVQVLLTLGELSVARGESARALTAFDAVLRLAPHDAEAFIESGWLRYELGLKTRRASEVDLGTAMLRRALVLAPRNGASHLYWGIVLLQRFHDVRAARAQVIRSGELPESRPEQAITWTLLRYFARH